MSGYPPSLMRLLIREMSDTEGSNPWSFRHSVKSQQQVYIRNVSCLKIRCRRSADLQLVGQQIDFIVNFF